MCDSFDKNRVLDGIKLEINDLHSQIYSNDKLIYKQNIKLKNNQDELNTINKRAKVLKNNICRAEYLKKSKKLENDNLKEQIKFKKEIIKLLEEKSIFF